MEFAKIANVACYAMMEFARAATGSVTAARFLANALANAQAGFQAAAAANTFFKTFFAAATRDAIDTQAANAKRL